MNNTIQKTMKTTRANGATVRAIMRTSRVNVRMAWQPMTNKLTTIMTRKRTQQTKEERPGLANDYLRQISDGLRDYREANILKLTTTELLAISWEIDRIHKIIAAGQKLSYTITKMSKF